MTAVTKLFCSKALKQKCSWCLLWDEMYSQSMMTSSTKHFARYWIFVRGIHRSPVNSPHKCQRRGALMFSLICAWMNGWVNNREAGDLRRHRTHYDVTVMRQVHWLRPIKSSTAVYHDNLSVHPNEVKTMDSPNPYNECMALQLIFKVPEYLSVIREATPTLPGNKTHRCVTKFGWIGSNKYPWN